MTPYKQLYRHEPKKGILGDCHRTAIACLLDLPPEEVPHFYEGLREKKDTKIALAREQEWLAARGLLMLGVAYSGDEGIQAVLDSVAIQNPDVHYILGGTSATGVGHSVVCKNNEIVHDPSIDAVGIVGAMDDGYYWVNFLGKLV